MFDLVDAQAILLLQLISLNQAKLSADDIDSCHLLLYSRLAVKNPLFYAKRINFSGLVSSHFISVYVHIEANQLDKPELLVIGYAVDSNALCS